MTDGASLAVALVQSIRDDPDALGMLRELVAQEQRHTPPLAYTVTQLADVTGLSPRAIRGAIHRGELIATRRGGPTGPYLIASEEARRWTTPSSRHERPRRELRRRVPSGVMSAALAGLSERSTKSPTGSSEPAALHSDMTKQVAGRCANTPGPATRRNP
jgi:hypothetical protein